MTEVLAKTGTCRHSKLMLSVLGDKFYCTESGIVVEAVTVPLVAVTVTS